MPDIETEKPTVLIAEDDSLLIEAYQSLLKSSGYQTIMASDGEVALKQAQKEKPEIILLDVNMPRMDGFEVLEELKASPKTKKIPVILLSNSHNDEYVKRAHSLGASEFLIKVNFNISYLIEKIKYHLKKKE